MDAYAHQFAHLHTNVSRHYWPADTYHRAPYKPILLLSVLDLIGLGVIQSNFVAFNEDLIDTFNLYFDRTIGNDKNNGPVLPFFHMRYEAFWHLVPAPGMEQALPAIRQIDTVGQLQQAVTGARLDDALFERLLNESYREELRRVLMATYFVPALQQKLAVAGAVRHATFEYGRTLLDRTKERFRLQEALEPQAQYQPEARSAAFRKVVIQAYDYTCAMCGVRVLTPEGRAAVVAAHIVPWHVSHNDDPRNGMALCGLHHWTFDQGLTGVDTDYRIRISPLISSDEAGNSPLVNLEEAEIHAPDERAIWPAKPALGWHQRNVFRGEALLRLF